jgi:rhomboid family GlyGly-CTERM serine protease
LSWVVTSCLLGFLALALHPTSPLQWALNAGPEPWRLVSASLAHWNAAHLLGNLVGLGLVTLLGWRADLRLVHTGAWLSCGPLLNLGLLGIHPQLPPYAGMSGLLHAGVALAVVVLLGRRGAERRIALGIGLGLLAKLLAESPWGPLLRPDDWWGGASLPQAHALGAAVGLGLGVLCAASSPQAKPDRKSPQGITIVFEN